MSAFISHITVRYAETDQMGIVHHSNYAVWFEQARTEMIAAAGFHYRDLESMGLLLPLTDLSCHYRIPALYEDQLDIETSVQELKPAHVTFAYRVFRAGTLLASGETRHGFVGKDMRPINLKKKYPDIYKTLEMLLPTE